MKPNWPQLTDAQALELLKMLAEYDYSTDLLWRVDDGVLSCFVNCNDFFDPGGDAEVVGPDDFPLLKLCLQDDPVYGDLLFAARKRRMKPWDRKMPEGEAVRKRFEDAPNWTSRD
jgi:hypothetical protein